MWSTSGHTDMRAVASILQKGRPSRLIFGGFRWVKTFVDIPECFPSSPRRICYLLCQCTRCTRRLTWRTVHGPLVAETNVASIRKWVIKGFEETRINTLRVQEEYIIYLVLSISWPSYSPYNFVLTLSTHSFSVAVWISYPYKTCSQ